jgi:diadenosine tetraphosphate (Ap4A) HIT family hydrolase
MVGLPQKGVKQDGLPPPFAPGYPSTVNGSCPRCAIIDGRSPSPGGIIYDDGLWIVVHHPSPESDPGELFVILRRHVESMAEITGAEAAALGPILRAGVTAIERIVSPERVYVASFNERVRHLHFYLLARTHAMPAGHVLSDLFRRGRGILRRWSIAQRPPDEARVRAAQRIRDEDVWRRLRD